MQTIQKYPVTDKTELPVGARIVRFASQKEKNGGSRPYLWAIIDPKQTGTEVHQFKVLSSDSAIPPSHDYVTTIDDGEMTWHIFDGSPALRGEEPRVESENRTGTGTDEVAPAEPEKVATPARFDRKRA